MPPTSTAVGVTMNPECGNVVVVAAEVDDCARDVVVVGFVVVLREVAPPGAVAFVEADPQPANVPAAIRINASDGRGLAR